MDWANIGITILKSIIISIPEETFIIYIALYILGKFEFIKLKSSNLPRFMACVIPLAFISIILRDLLPFLTDYLMPIGIIIAFLLIVFIYKVHERKEVLRAFVGTILGFILIAMCQIIYVPLVLFGTGISLETINKSILIVFLWTLPERVMEFSILVLLTLRKSMAAKINIFSILSKNRLIAFTTLFLLTFNVIFLVIMGKLICFDNLLVGSSLLAIVSIIALIIIFPVMNISLLIVVIYSVYYKYSIRLLLSKERMSTLVNVLAVYTEEKNYSKIDNLVTDLHNQVNIL